jgi:hypothetical protein
MTVDLVAAWDAEHGWHNVEINTVSLVRAEAEKRAQRRTAAEDFFDDIEADDD